MKPGQRLLVKETIFPAVSGSRWWMWELCSEWRQIATRQWFMSRPHECATICHGARQSRTAASSSSVRLQSPGLDDDVTLSCGQFPAELLARDGHSKKNDLSIVHASISPPTMLWAACALLQKSLFPVNLENFPDG